MMWRRPLPSEHLASEYPQSCEPWESLIGVNDWPGTPVPVILVSDPDQIPDVAFQCRKAAVLSLPADCELWTAVESWALYLPLLGADVTLWAETPRDAALLRAIVPVLDVAGVSTLRWAMVENGALRGTQAIWRDREALR